MAFDPWYKSSLKLSVIGQTLLLGVPHDVFSTQRIDEGTLLLLANLPADSSETSPKLVLDMGCGYGALGLPLAARFPDAQFELVDRDLLAVEWSQKNAQAHQLGNVAAYPSLGFRDLKRERYDWVLCNVPARIGRPFIENIFAEGAQRLNPQGELRVVVIRDLGPVVETIATEKNWPIREIARGPRHIIYNLCPHLGSENGIAVRSDSATLGAKISNAQLYTYDEVTVGTAPAEIKLVRPFDIAGDNARLVNSLPALIDTLPRKAPGSVFAFRCSYGILPLLARTLWPNAHVVGSDRDILATTFARENAERLGLSGPALEIRESVDVMRALSPDERFDLALGEISPSVGEQVTEAELVGLAQHLTPGGQALLLTIEKIEREWIKGIAARRKLGVVRLLARDGHVVLRLTSS